MSGCLISIIVIVNKKAHSQSNSSSKQFLIFRVFNILPFWKSSASGPASRDFLKHCSTLRDRTFFLPFGSYLRREWSDFHENFITDVSLDKEVTVPIKYRDPESVSGYGLVIQTIFSLARRMQCLIALPSYSEWRRMIIHRHVHATFYRAA